MTPQIDAMGFDSHDPAIVVEAFLDGEPVAARDLEAALAQPAAREHFVDLLLLRRAVGVAGAPEPSAWFDAKPGRRLRRLGAVAAILFSVSAGYLLGQRSAPVPAAASVEAFVHSVEAPAAPAPTRVIQLTRGVNWVDRQEGR